jgi:hypothetical protein
MSRIEEFPSSVIERIGFYVYLLIDPETDQVFYVGKGIGNRIFAHLNAALADETLSDKLDRIRAIHAKGLEVRHVVHRHGLTEKEAIEVEAALIDYIGLTELTNQVQGYKSDDRGRMTVAEVIAKYEAPIAVIKEPVILIIVNQFFKRGMSDKELYEITRGKWAMGTRRNKAKYAFAVYKGIIREVYEIERWLPISVGEDEVIRRWRPRNAKDAEVKRRNRWQFEGKIAHSLRHYVGKSTENYAVIGARNSFRYVNC